MKAVLLAVLPVAAALIAVGCAQQSALPAGIASKLAAATSENSDPFEEILRVGSECPAGSRQYCGDQFPYCCYAPSSQVYYCALDIQHCTRQ